MLAILGSPRADGLSARMLDAFLTELPKGTAVTRISCYDRRPIPCDDCRYCYHREGCSKRDLDDFYAALEEADLLCGYTTYLDLVRDLFPDKPRYATPMTKERDRCLYALELSLIHI